jgi:Tfp pilus assembly protein FimT
MKNYNSKLGKSKSFSLVEILIIIGIMAVLIAIAIPSYRFFQKETDLNNSTEEIINTLRLAQNKTLASEGPSRYGVYFDAVSTPDQYTLFKGTSYASRDNPADEIHKLANSLEISDINLSGGSEIVFDRILGTTSQFGSVSIRLKDTPDKIKTIYVENSGQVSLTSPTVPSDTSRIKDSRHGHFTYSQDAQEAVTLHLIFPDFPGDNYDISFQNYLNNYLNPGKTEFYWEGTVAVGPTGSKTDQKLKIHTHSLGITSAQFSIHRDKRYNDKALSITLDDQNLINYTADGQTAKGASVFVSEPQWQ